MYLLQLAAQGCEILPRKYLVQLLCHLAAIGMPQVPPQQRAAPLAAAEMGPDLAVRPGLARWAQQMQLPGIDT